MTTPAESLPASLSDAVAAVREAEEKAHTLHEERGKAHGEMRQAVAQHEFLVTATRVADSELAEFRHRVKRLIERQAYALESSG